MQIVSSLLDREIDSIEDHAIHRILQHTQNRIYSMALVHQELYQSGDLAEIGFESYLNSLVTGILQSYGEDGGRIALTFDVEDITLVVERAIPLGLIVNELVSNAIKYAFPQRRQGAIAIAFRRAGDGEALLTVRDDGIGLNAESEQQQAKSLGHQLVRDLTHQLDGTLEINDNGGAEFNITLPLRD